MRAAAASSRVSARLEQLRTPKKNRTRRVYTLTLPPGVMEYAREVVAKLRREDWRINSVSKLVEILLERHAKASRAKPCERCGGVIVHGSYCSAGRAGARVSAPAIAAVSARELRRLEAAAPEGFGTMQARAREKKVRS